MLLRIHELLGIEVPSGMKAIQVKIRSICKLNPINANQFTKEENTRPASMNSRKKTNTPNQKQKYILASLLVGWSALVHNKEPSYERWEDVNG